MILLFRAWDEYLKKLLCDGFSIIGEVTIFSGLDIMISETPVEGVGHLERMLSLVITQYINVDDRNGKKIFNGDIVNYAVKKRLCKNPKCDEDQPLGIDTFCPSCGTKTTYEDMITTAEVVFDRGAFGYQNDVGEDSFQRWPIYAAESYIEWVEIIGNKWENPELYKTINNE